MNYQKLFNYMSEEHGVTLLETDMQEICNIVNEMQFRPTLPSLPTDLEIEKAALRYGEKKNGSDVFNTAPITDFKSGVNWLRDFINQSPVVGDGLTTEQAVSKITSELKSDDGLRLAYKSNIAIAFQDEFNEFRQTHNRITTKDVHEISNKAAERFLNLWCK